MNLFDYMKYTQEQKFSKKNVVALIISSVFLALFFGGSALALNWDDILAWRYENSKDRVTKKVSKAIAKRDFVSARTYTVDLKGNDQAELMKEINIAELNLVLNQSGLEDAYYLANELNAKQDLLSALSVNLFNLLKNGNSDKVVNVMAGWTFDHSFSDNANNINDSILSKAMIDTYLDQDEKVVAIACNILYNKESKAYNSVLDGLVNYGAMNEDYGLVKKAIKLYRPTAKEVSKSKVNKTTYNYRYQQINTDKNAAIAKARASGIKL